MYIFDIKYGKAFTPKRILNSVRLLGSYYFSVLTGNIIVSGYPLVLSIEPTNICNLKCPQCPTGMGILKRPQGYMDFALYRSIIDSIGDYIITAQFFFQGEPFLHKQLPEMIAYANHKKIYTITSTNGHFLTESLIALLCDSGLDVLIIGIDGVTADTYQFYRRNGSLNIVLDGIRRVIDTRNQKKRKHPKLYLQFLVMKHNEDQIDAVKRIGKELGVDKVLLKTAQVYQTTDVDDFLPDNPELSRYEKSSQGMRLKSPLPNRCRRVWTNTVFTWDGTAASCCFDKDAEYSFGVWNTKPFKLLWKSDRAMQLRRRIFKNRSSIPICTNCTEGIREFL